jgi:hypothetical protein
MTIACALSLNETSGQNNIAIDRALPRLDAAEVEAPAPRLNRHDLHRPGAIAELACVCEAVVQAVALG